MRRLTGEAGIRLPGWYDRVWVHREMADGTFIAAEADRHPDPVAEQIRWEACEGQLLQIIGRARAIRRGANNPVEVLLFTDVPVPLPVNECVTVAQVAPGPVDRMLAATGIRFDNAEHAARATGLWVTVVRSVRL